MRLIRITIQEGNSLINADIFAFSPKLEFLDVGGELIATPPPEVASFGPSHKARISLPELTFLRVSIISMATLARLQIPKVRTVIITQVQRACISPAPAPGELVIPSLKELQIASVSPTIACINAPELDILCLSIPALTQADADHLLESVFHGAEGMMQPRHLTLRTLRGMVHDKVLIPALRLLEDRLVSLELNCRVPPRRTFWMEMTPSTSTLSATKSVATSIDSTVTGGGNVPAGGRKYNAPLLPNLRCLVVDVNENPMATGDGDDMRVILSQLIESRQRNGPYKPLMHLACKWLEGPKIEEMVGPLPCSSCAERAVRD